MTTSLALQIAALVVHKELGLYQLILVTVLGLPAFLIPWGYEFPEMPRQTEAPFRSSAATAVIAHEIIFFSYTTWVWGFKIPKSPCRSMVHVLGLRIDGWLRYTVLIFLGLTLGLPFIKMESMRHLLFQDFITYGLVYDVAAVIIGRPTPVHSLWATLFSFMVHAPWFKVRLGPVTLTGIVVSIVASELLIREAHAAMPAGNDHASDWGYGQITAMILLLQPLFTLCKIVNEQRPGIRARFLGHMSPTAARSLYHASRQHVRQHIDLWFATLAAEHRPTEPNPVASEAHGLPVDNMPIAVRVALFLGYTSPIPQSSVANVLRESFRRRSVAQAEQETERGEAEPNPVASEAQGSMSIVARATLTLRRMFLIDTWSLAIFASQQGFRRGFSGIEQESLDSDPHRLVTDNIPFAARCVLLLGYMSPGARNSVIHVAWQEFRRRSAAWAEHGQAEPNPVASEAQRMLMDNMSIYVRAALFLGRMSPIVWSSLILASRQEFRRRSTGWAEQEAEMRQAEPITSPSEGHHAFVDNMPSAVWVSLFLGYTSPVARNEVLDASWPESRRRFAAGREQEAEHGQVEPNPEAHRAVMNNMPTAARAVPTRR